MECQNSQVDVAKRRIYKSLDLVHFCAKTGETRGLFTVRSAIEDRNVHTIRWNCCEQITWSRKLRRPNATAATKGGRMVCCILQDGSDHPTSGTARASYIDNTKT